MIGITGGIGAGKSIVSRILRQLGFEVYDCDFEARLIMDGSIEIKQAISTRFGAHCVDEYGCLNRREIAHRVFGNIDDRIWLNSLVHAMVRDDVLRKSGHSSSNLFFVESAILKSSGLAEYCSQIWIVEACVNERLKRAAKRDGISENQVRDRIAAQQTEYEDFPAHAKLMKIDNSGNISLLHQIQTILTR